MNNELYTVITVVKMHEIGMKALYNQLGLKLPSKRGDISQIYSGVWDFIFLLERKKKCSKINKPSEQMSIEITGNYF